MDRLPALLRRRDDGGYLDGGYLRRYDNNHTLSLISYNIARVRMFFREKNAKPGIRGQGQ